MRRNYGVIGCGQSRRCARNSRPPPRCLHNPAAWWRPMHRASVLVLPMGSRLDDAQGIRSRPFFWRIFQGPVRLPATAHTRQDSNDRPWSTTRTHAVTSSLLFAVMFPQHRVAIRMHGTDGFPGLMAVVQMHWVIKKGRREQSLSNWSRHDAGRRITGQRGFAKPAFPLLQANISLTDNLSLCRSQIVVICG